MKHLLSTLLAIGLVSRLIAQPVITQNPVDIAVCIGECADFNVSANGQGLSYQWKMVFMDDTTSLANQQAANLEFCETDSTSYDSAAFHCVVMDVNGDSVLSNAALLSIDSCLAPVAGFTWQWDWEEGEVCFTSTSKHAETLIWLYGDGSTNANNESSPCHVYTAMELYYVELQVFNDHGSDVLQQSIDFLGIEEISATVAAFPNPVSGRLHVTSDQRIDRIELLNIQGHVTRMVSPLQNKFDFDVSDLESGVYIMNIITGVETVQKRILIL